MYKRQHHHCARDLLQGNPHRVLKRARPDTNRGVQRALDQYDLSLIHIYLLQPQDVMSRHRGAKPPRRCGLLGEISLLSPG